MDWKWFELSIDGGSAGITPSHVFRGRRVEQVLARETIQNSWDASRRYLRDNPKHQTLVKYEYRTLVGDERDSLVEALRLDELAARVAADDGLEREIGGGSWLDAVEGDAGIPVLHVSDYGAHGLYGHPSLLEDSALWLAMRTTSITDKKGPGDSSGGSFGLGKGAMVYASHAGVVVAYSRFDQLGDDPVTRRLEGAVRWPAHKYTSLTWTGQGRFGTGPEAEPFEDAAADTMASRLLMPGRTRSDDEPYPGANLRGTTFTIVDPRLDPLLLRPAIEEFWWPALAPGEFASNLLIEVEIDGVLHNPNFQDDKRRDDLIPYLDALDLARGRKPPAGAHQKRIPLRHQKLGELGDLGVVMLQADADEEAEDFDADHVAAEGVHGRDGAVIALTRNTRMVVQYHVRSTRKNIRGVFVANPALDDALRGSEPPTHDDWGEHPEQEDVHLGAVIKAKINDALREFARDARPPRLPGEARIPALDKLLAGLGGRGQGDAEGQKRPFLIQGPHGERIVVDTFRNPNDPKDMIRARTAFRVALNPDAEPRKTLVGAMISVEAHHLDENGAPIGLIGTIRGRFETREGVEAMPFTFQQPRDGVAKGDVKIEPWSTFSWVSEPYERDSRIGCEVRVEYS